MKTSPFNRALALTGMAIALVLPASAQEVSANRVNLQVIVVGTAAEAQDALTRLRKGED
jgi:hypothetical protein